MAGIGPGYKGGLLPKQYSEEEITEGLMAMIAWAGNASAASRYLKSQKQIELPAVTLNGWKTSHAIRYDELREKYSGQVEAALADERRDSAMQATQLPQLAMGRRLSGLSRVRSRILRGLLRTRLGWLRRAWVSCCRLRAGRRRLWRLVTCRRLCGRWRLRV